MNIFSNLQKEAEIPLANQKFFRDKVIYWDTETTGINPEEDRIIQIAMIETINGQEKRRFCTLINPCGVAVNESAYKVHKISDEQLKNQPTFKEKIPEIKEMLSGAIVCAFNQNFDIGFLNAELARNGETVTFKDLVKEDFDIHFFSRSFYSKKVKQKVHTLDKFMEAVKIDVSERDERHDALIDTKLMMEAFMKALQNPENDISRMKNFEKLMAPKPFAPLEIKHLDLVRSILSDEDKEKETAYLDRMEKSSKTTPIAKLKRQQYSDQNNIEINKIETSKPRFKL